MINEKTVSSSDHIRSAFPKATKACSSCQGCQKLGFTCGYAGQRLARGSTSCGMLEKDQQRDNLMSQKLLPTKTWAALKNAPMQPTSIHCKVY